MDGYSLKYFFVSYDETKIPIVDEEGKIVVRKKQYIFQKKKQGVGHSNQLMSRINKLLSQEFFWNVSSTLCYAQNCCQHFPSKKTKLLKEIFWGLSFEKCKTYGMDIPKRLHVKASMK